MCFNENITYRNNIKPNWYPLIVLPGFVQMEIKFGFLKNAKKSPTE